MAYSAWLFSAFFAVGCSFPVDEFTAGDGSPQVDTAVADTAVADAEDETAGDATDDSTLDDATADASSDACPPGETYCSAGCTNLKSDNNNCGKCGVVCMATKVCKNLGTGPTCK